MQDFLQRSQRIQEVLGSQWKAVLGEFLQLCQESWEELFQENPGAVEGFRRVFPMSPQHWLQASREHRQALPRPGRVSGAVLSQKCPAVPSSSLQQHPKFLESFLLGFLVSEKGLLEGCQAEQKVFHLWNRGLLRFLPRCYPKGQEGQARKGMCDQECGHNEQTAKKHS